MSRNDRTIAYTLEGDFGPPAPERATFADAARALRVYADEILVHLGSAPLEGVELEGTVEISEGMRFVIRLEPKPPEGS